MLSVVLHTEAKETCKINLRPRISHQPRNDTFLGRVDTYK